MNAFVEIVVTYKLYMLLSPCVAIFIYDCFNDNMILSFYGRWLRKEDIYNKRITEINVGVYDRLKNDGLKDSEIEERLLPTIATPRWKYPLGYCLKCFSFWVFIILLIIPSKIAIFTIAISLNHCIIARYGRML